MLRTERKPTREVAKHRYSENRNYLIKEDRAYTEDGLLVFNIFFGCKKMTKRTVYDYFIYFGEIKSVKLYPYKDHTRGIVNFAEASSAAKALQRVNYCSTGPLYVRAAYSWYQPNGSKQCSTEDCYTAANPSCSADRKLLNILQLPDYCLEEICRNMKLSEQIHFARVCLRFHEVFVMYSKRVFKSFDCHAMNSMSRFEATYFIRYVGEHIKTLKAECRHLPYIVKFIARFCVNVKRLSLTELNLPHPRLENILRNMRGLQELNLRDVNSLHGADIKLLHKIPSLEIIDLSGVLIRGDVELIKNMPQLVGLTLQNCIALEVSDLVDILKSLRRFKFLDIRGSIFEDDYPELLNALLDYGKQLEKLKIFYYGTISYASLAQLPNLKSLQLDKGFSSKPLSKNLNDEALRKFCNLKKLQKIAIICSDITNEGVLELLYNCKNLCSVNMRHCTKIDSDFITEAIKILEERKDSLRKPVSFNVYGTSVYEAAFKDMPDYKAAAEAGLIKVVFDPRPEYYPEDFTSDLD